jgi:hypothetical protein
MLPHRFGAIFSRISAPSRRARRLARKVRLSGQRLEERCVMTSLSAAAISSQSAQYMASPVEHFHAEFAPSVVTPIRPEAIDASLVPPLPGAQARADYNAGSGVLRVVGTPWADKIKVVESGGWLSVEVFAGITHPLLPLADYEPIPITAPDGPAESLDASAIQKIEIYGYGGDDRLTFEQNRPVSSHLAALLLPKELRADLVIEMFGDEGDDTLELVGNGSWRSVAAQPQVAQVILDGGENDDTLRGGAGDDALYGGGGYDTLFGNGGTDWLFGDAGNDKLVGGDGDDWLYGEDHHDTLFGDDDATPWSGGGGDHLFGGDGYDTIYGGGFDDELYGGNGNDYLYGGGENDFLVGGGDDDHVYGNQGADTLYGDMSYGDTILGPEGRDKLDGGEGEDTLYGGGGDDTLGGGAHHDELNGESGADTLRGDAGDDWLDGGGESDHLFGGPDHDTLIGGPKQDGADWLHGEAGPDDFYLMHYVMPHFDPYGTSGSPGSTTDDHAVDFNPDHDRQFLVGHAPRRPGRCSTFGCPETPGPDYPTPSPPTMSGKSVHEINATPDAAESESDPNFPASDDSVVTALLAPGVDEVQTFWTDEFWTDGFWTEGTTTEGYWTEGSWTDGIWTEGYWTDESWTEGYWAEDGAWIEGSWSEGYWTDGFWTEGYWSEGFWTESVTTEGFWTDGYWTEGHWTL